MRWRTARRRADSVDSRDSEKAVDAVDTDAAVETATVPDGEVSDDDEQPTGDRSRFGWSRAIGFGLLPAIALGLALGAGFLKYQEHSFGDTDASRESVQAATDGTIALLSYHHDTVQQDLEAAEDKLTGSFLEAYIDLTRDVVIPGAQQKRISAEAEVPAASSISATTDRAVALLFVNQTVVVGEDPPTSTASRVRVSLEKVDGRWLISQFDPV